MNQKRSSVILKPISKSNINTIYKSKRNSLTIRDIRYDPTQSKEKPLVQLIPFLSKEEVQKSNLPYLINFFQEYRNSIKYFETPFNIAPRQMKMPYYNFSLLVGTLTHKINYNCDGKKSNAKVDQYQSDKGIKYILKTFWHPVGSPTKDPYNFKLIENFVSDKYNEYTLKKICSGCPHFIKPIHFALTYIKKSNILVIEILEEYGGNPIFDSIPFNSNQIFGIFIQNINVIKYLNALKIPLFVITTENISIEKNSSQIFLKYSDINEEQIIFNISKINNGRMISESNSCYLSPEILLLSGDPDALKIIVTKIWKCQIYSLGIFILQIINFFPAMYLDLKDINKYKNSEIEYKVFMDMIEQYILNCKKQKLLQNILSVIKTCLSYNPNDRPSPNELSQLLENIDTKDCSNISNEYDQLKIRREIKRNVEQFSTIESSPSDDIKIVDQHEQVNSILKNMKNNSENSSNSKSSPLEIKNNQISPNQENFKEKMINEILEENQTLGNLNITLEKQNKGLLVQISAYEKQIKRFEDSKKNLSITQVNNLGLNQVNNSTNKKNSDNKNENENEKSIKELKQKIEALIENNSSVEKENEELRKNNKEFKESLIDQKMSIEKSNKNNKDLIEKNYKLEEQIKKINKGSSQKNSELQEQIKQGNKNLSRKNFELQEQIKILNNDLNKKNLEIQNQIKILNQLKQTLKDKDSENGQLKLQLNQKKNEITKTDSEKQKIIKELNQIIQDLKESNKEYQMKIEKFNAELVQIKNQENKVVQDLKKNIDILTNEKDILENNIKENKKKIDSDCLVIQENKFYKEKYDELTKEYEAFKIKHQDDINHIKECELKINNLLSEKEKQNPNINENKEDLPNFSKIKERIMKDKIINLDYCNSLSELATELYEILINYNKNKKIQNYNYVEKMKYDGNKYYTGCVINSKVPHGPGMIINTNKFEEIKFIGEFEFGKLKNNLGMWIKGNEKYYFGRIVNEKNVDFPTFAIFLNNFLKKNSYYFGNIEDFSENGFGRYYYDNGLYYKGQLKDGHREGKGTLKKPDGEIYKGYWKKDKREGNGKRTFPNGDYYIGDWKDDLAEGNGKFVYQNGKYYEGEFKKGNKEGRGKFHYVNQGKITEIQEGTWMNDLRHGLFKIKTLNQKEPLIFDFSNDMMI